MVLLLGKPPLLPSTNPSLAAISEAGLGSMPSGKLFSTWAAKAEGLGGRGGGVGVEAWSSSESTLGVEDGRRGACGCGVEAGRGIW